MKTLLELSQLQAEDMEARRAKERHSRIAPPMGPPIRKGPTPEAGKANSTELGQQRQQAGGLTIRYQARKG